MNQPDPGNAAQDVLHFWFAELEPKDWWRKNAELDLEIGRRFEHLLAAGKRGELSDWRATAEGRLAEILVLDQFSRNIFRDTPDAFAADGMALILAQEAIRAGADANMSPPRKSFLYMPFMHSESRLIHEQAVRLFDQPGLENNLDFELKHKAIIDRFGRYPHRNALLGRVSTADELDFLKLPGSGF